MKNSIIPFTFFALVAFLFLSSTTLTAQSAGQDVISLKDGTKHQGYVIEQKPGVHIKVLRMPQKDTLTIELKDIHTLEKTIEFKKEEGSDSFESTLDLESLKMFNVNRFHCYLRGNIGAGDFSFQGFGLDLMYTVTRKMQVGAGVSYFGVVSENIHFMNSIPLTANLNYTLQENYSGRAAILASLHVGYNQLLKREFVDEASGLLAERKGGIYLYPSIGYRVNLAKELGVMLNVGYQYTHAKNVSTTGNIVVGKQHWNNIKASAAFFF